MASPKPGRLRLRMRARLLTSNPRLALKRALLGRKTLTDVPLKRISDLVSRDGIILEAGAADGADTTVLAGLVPDGYVFAFEPVPSLFQALEERTKDLPNVWAKCLALANEQGTELLYTSFGGRQVEGSSSLLRPTNHLSLYPDVLFDDGSLVECVNIDEYILRNRWPLPTFAWLDLQGMELAILESSPKTRSSLVGIYMEVFRTPLYEGAPTYDSVVSRMHQWGFEILVDQVGATAGNILFRRAET